MAFGPSSCGFPRKIRMLITETLTLVNVILNCPAFPIVFFTNWPTGIEKRPILIPYRQPRGNIGISPIFGPNLPRSFPSACKGQCPGPLVRRGPTCSSQFTGMKARHWSIWNLRYKSGPPSWNGCNLLCEREFCRDLCFPLF